MTDIHTTQAKNLRDRAGVCSAGILLLNQAMWSYREAGDYAMLGEWELCDKSVAKAETCLKSMRHDLAPLLPSSKA